MKKVLLLGAGFYHRRVIEVLRDGAFYVIALDRDPHAPGAALAHEFHPIDVTDIQGVMGCAYKSKADCVMPLNEFGVSAHAHASDALGLPGIPLSSFEAVVDKEVMRRRWREAGLPQPDFIAFSSMEEGVVAARKIGFPCVVKPADSGGSGRGIMILEREDEVDEGVAFAKPFARNGRFVIETFIKGVEMTVEGLCRDGEHRVLAMSDKYKPPLKTRVATSLNYPADFNAAALERAVRLVNAAVAALGLNHCATHTELIVADNGAPYLLELGARGGGGHIFSTIVQAVSGVNMPVETARILTGEAPRWTPKFAHGACYRFFNPPYGRLAKVENLEFAASLNGVLDIGMFKNIGERVGLLSNSQERAGFVVTTGKDRQSAWELANHVERLVKITVHEYDGPCAETGRPESLENIASLAGERL